MNNAHLGRWILLIFAFSTQAALGQEPSKGAPFVRSEQELTNKIRGELGGQNQGVELLLHGSCATPNTEAILIDPISWKNPDQRDQVAGLTAALVDNKQLSVAQISPGLIVIRDVGVHNDLLETRIEHLKLTKLEQYSPEEAIFAAINSRSVQLSMKRLRMRMIASETGLEHVNPYDKPHLERGVKGMTLDEFFSSILQIFGGTLVYEDCVDLNGARRFDVRYSK